MVRIIGALVLLVGALDAAPVELVRAGRSDHVIYLPAGQPSSVQAAAQDLRAYLKRATGADLAIVAEPREPLIALGDSPLARAAGLAAGELPLAGFRIVTRASSVFILGPDTADGELTPQGGTSAGTRHGVNAFLERFVGVRWLVPGPHGDDVPQTADLTIPETDLRDAPFFLNRRVPYTQQDRPEVKTWWARQGLGWSLYLHHSHNFEPSIPAAQFDTHPDWFAERGGVRIPPVGRYKLCLTNPGLQRGFAEAAIRYFDARPQATCYSLSPSDSAGWCECPPCLAAYERDPEGQRSVTPAVLRFYNGVARIVAEKYPDKVLAGYIYAAYVYPPSQPIKLEPNVFLVWAPSFDYGYTLHRPEIRERWDRLVAEWTRVTENLAYYDLPFNLSTDSGALNPPGLKILKWLYPRLKRANMKGVYVYGIEGWGRGGPLNYLLARLAWNPDADVDALFTEYCDRAYGAASEPMQRLWILLDDALDRHYQADPKASYTLTADILQAVYAKTWPEVERLYGEALARVDSPAAKARLTMVGDNLTVLLYHLRQNRLVEQPERSPLYLTDDSFGRFLTERRDSLALQPVGQPARKVPQVQVAAAQVAGDPPVPFLLRGDQQIVIVPRGQQTVKVRFQLASARRLLHYAVLGADGASIAAGVATSAPLELDAAGSGVYHLSIQAGNAAFGLSVEGGAWAVNGRAGEDGLHFLGKVTPVWFEVRPGTASFTLSLAATPPGETALATLHRPDGAVAARYDCSVKPVDRQRIDQPPAGWWRLVIEPAPTGVVDDVYVLPGPELSGWCSLAPAQALAVW